MPRLKFHPPPRNAKLTSAGRLAPPVWLNSVLSAQKGVFDSQEVLTGFRKWLLTPLVTPKKKTKNDQPEDSQSLVSICILALG